MRERLLGRRNFREIVTSFKNRIFGSPAAPPETPERAPDNRRMWEILNVIPLIELDKLSPEERRKFEERSIQRLQGELRFQASLNQTVDEFFGEKPSTQRAPQK